MPTVSIIIPVYNRESFVSDTVRSALDQTWEDLEVIVVDDHSSDASIEAALSHRDQRVRAIQSHRRGAAAARNTGLKEAAGDYIQYLDADDLLSAGKLHIQIERLRNQTPGSIASGPWGRFHLDPGETGFDTEGVWIDSQPIDWLIDSWSGGGMMQTACWLTPRPIAENAGPWDEALSLHDDGEYFSRVILASKSICFCPEAKVHYRSGHPDSLSRQRDRTGAESALRVYSAYATNMLPVENSERTRLALATNFARFVYEFHPHHPDLLERARDAIADLGVRKVPAVGGSRFRSLAKLIGFERALKLRDRLGGR